MPMESKAERAFLWIHHPEIAKRFEKETPKGPLPEHVKMAQGGQVCPACGYALGGEVEPEEVDDEMTPEDPEEERKKYALMLRKARR